MAMGQKDNGDHRWRSGLCFPFTNLFFFRYPVFLTHSHIRALSDQSHFTNRLKRAFELLERGFHVKKSTNQGDSLGLRWSLKNRYQFN